MPRLICTALVAVFLCCSVRHAAAIPTFQKVFDQEYLENHKDPEFASYVKKKVKCFVCHQGKKKTNHNPYGVQLARILDKKKDKDFKDPATVKRIKAALVKVGKMHSDPKDKESPTYAEMIARGELPGGKLEEVKKEPSEEELKERKQEEERKIDDKE